MLKMLTEVDSQVYRKLFPSNPHPFVSEPFIDLNQGKVESIVRLVDDEKQGLGLVAGIKEGILKSPFSAPFGGFHFRNEIIYISEIDQFIVSLQAYITAKGLKGIEITLPPDLYHPSFNAKMISSLIRNGFRSGVPDITGWVNLREFTGVFSQKNSRECYRQAVRNNLSFIRVTEEKEMEKVYQLICENRAKFGRPIFMTLNDILETGKLWPADFFMVNSGAGEIVASAIMYRSLPDICYAVFWGDNEAGRSMRAMDFLVYNLFEHYRKMDFRYLDLGISTEAGIPNEGLLRFKESHDAESSIRYRFSWYPAAV